MTIATSPPPVRQLKLPLRVVILFGLLVTAPAGFAADLIFLVEDTAAMRDAKARSGAVEIVSRTAEALAEDARIGAVAYNDLARVVLPLGANSGEQRPRLLGALRGLSMTSRYANPGAGLERTLYELQQATDSLQPAVVLLHASGVNTGDTEQDNAFRRWTDLLASDAGDAGIPIHVVSFGDTADGGLSVQIATNSRSSHHAVATEGPFDDVIAELAALLGASGNRTVAAAANAGSMPTAAVETAPAAATGTKILDAVESIDTSGDTPATAITAAPQSTEGLAPGAAARPANGDAAKPLTGAPNSTTFDASTSEISANDSGLGLIFAVGSGAFAAIAVLLLMLRRKKRPSPEKPVERPASASSNASLLDRGLVSGKARYDITSRIVRVSRQPGQDSANVICLTIVDDVISREHAVIECHDGAYWITDPGSNNGTFVNGTRIGAPTRLQDGDEVRFATHVFDFQQRASSAAPATGSGKAETPTPADENPTVVQPVEASSAADAQENDRLTTEPRGGEPGPKTISELERFDAEAWLADGDANPAANGTSGEDRTQVRKPKN